MACGVHDVHLEIHSADETLELVQVVAEHIARRLGLDEETLHWTVMAVRETVVNAMIHGNRNDSSKLVFVDFSASPDADPTELIVRVRDQGTGFDPGHINDPRSPDHVTKSGGRGIFLIRQFMDDVSMERARDGGMEVRMLKRIRS